MRTFICVIFLINNYGLLFSQQTIGLLLADSLIIKDFDKQLFYTDYVGKHRKSFNFSVRVTTFYKIQTNLQKHVSKIFLPKIAFCFITGSLAELLACPTI